MASSNPIPYSITCHCGAVAHTIATSSQWARDVEICHCDTCRHATGILCTSFLRIHAPPNLTTGLTAYMTAEGVRRFFCTTCGCHVFCCDGTSELETSPRDGRAWLVATGCIVGQSGGHDSSAASNVGEGGVDLQFVRHVNVGATKDGGLAPFIREIDGRELEVFLGQSWNSLGHIGKADRVPASPQKNSGQDQLPGSCHCGRVRLHITRPNEASRIPHSGYSDLIIPFYTRDSRIPNPDDEKWWLRPAGSTSPTKYLAGTCACRSCRLISGFEIQTWAFVPRANIVMHLPGGTQKTLDFADLPPGVLKSYESSEGVMREFCPECGATVFWHDKWRPDLMDVSVGLLDGPEGARAEEWLDWCTDRVSFFEETETGRTGGVARAAKSLMESLDRGLRDWDHERVGERPAGKLEMI